MRRRRRTRAPLQPRAMAGFLCGFHHFVVRIFVVLYASSQVDSEKGRQTGPGHSSGISRIGCVSGLHDEDARWSLNDPMPFSHGAGD